MLQVSNLNMDSHGKAHKQTNEMETARDLPYTLFPRRFLESISSRYISGKREDSFTLCRN